MLELVTHRLRLKADPSRVVVRPFHVGWQANGKAGSRTERLPRTIRVSPMPSAVADVSGRAYPPSPSTESEPRSSV